MIVADQTRSEQVMELREMKATVHERLQASEVQVRDVRLDAIRYKNREQENLTKIASLEAQVSQVRSELNVVPETYLRLHDLETCNKELIQESSNSKKEASALSKQLQQKAKDIDSLNGRLSGLQLQLEDTQASNAAIQEVKISCQNEALVQRDKLREELSHAASVELTGVKSELVNALRQLKQLQIDSTKGPQAPTEQLDSLKTSNSSLKKTLAARKTSLQSAQTELQSEVSLHLPAILRETRIKINKARGEVSASRKNNKPRERQVRCNCQKE